MPPWVGCPNPSCNRGWIWWGAKDKIVANCYDDPNAYREVNGTDNAGDKIGILLHGEFVEVTIVANYYTDRKTVMVRYNDEYGNTVEMEVPTNQSETQVKSGCGNKFCRLCLKPWKQSHAGLTCKQWEQTNDPNYLKNEQYLKKHTVKCPGCNLPMQKIIGC